MPTCPTPGLHPIAQTSARVPAPTHFPFITSSSLACMVSFLSHVPSWRFFFLLCTPSSSAHDYAKATFLSYFPLVWPQPSSQDSLHQPSWSAAYITNSSDFPRRQGQAVCSFNFIPFSMPSTARSSSHAKLVALPHASRPCFLSSCLANPQVVCQHAKSACQCVSSVSSRKDHAALAFHSCA